MKAVTKNPGASSAMIAAKLGMRSPNCLYRVLPQLERAGVIVSATAAGTVLERGWDPRSGFATWPSAHGLNGRSPQPHRLLRLTHLERSMRDIGLRDRKRDGVLVGAGVNVVAPAAAAVGHSGEGRGFLAGARDDRTRGQGRADRSPDARRAWGPGRV